ncbi:MAG: RNA 2',3'-cyclic phosphodiesterase [Candidatus Micrarchaeota archaeon]
MRVFVAIQVPDNIKKKAELVGREIEQEGVVPVKQENMHITLKFIGDVEPEQVEIIKKRLQSVEHRKIECNLNGAGVFPNEKYVKVVWIGAESNGEMEKLAIKIHDALAEYSNEEKFSAHLTIARVKKKLEIKEFLAKHDDENFGKIAVKKFELIQSVLGEVGGPRYITLASFNLD